MLEIGDTNISTVDGDNAEKVPADNAIIIHQSKSNELEINSSNDALVEGGEFYVEIDQLIASFVQLEKEHLISRKKLISQISDCLFAHHLTDVKANSRCYDALFLLYAKYEMGNDCSFKTPYNIAKYNSDYEFEKQFDSATTELNPFMKLKHSKPGK